MRQAKGFTLIELVTVMVILAIVSIGIAGFIRSGTQIYSDITQRDQLLSQSRFIVERLNREIRKALPNSLRVNGDSTVQCLEFVPVVWSTFYFDIPVAPEAADDRVKVVATASSSDAYQYTSGDHVVVYPVSQAAVYDSSFNARYALDGAPEPDPADSKKSILSFESAVQFATDSPHSRLYIVAPPVSYCAGTTQITRHANYGYYDTQRIGQANLGQGVLMAEHLHNELTASDQDKPFRIRPASLSRNAFVLTLLRFEMEEEVVVFNNEVHIPNVP